MNNFYITTTTPYVNASPHIGFALEILAADVLARYHQLLGDNVIFNTGTDEHGQKIYEEALAKNLTPQAYVDSMVVKFQDLIQLLNISSTHFIRTTDAHHIKAAQEFWQRCDTNGDIYKDQYEVYYCVGCELEKQLGDLVDDRCPLHPNRELEKRVEENYFFRFSNYQQALLDLYKTNPNFVRPASKQKEISAFVSQGLKDFSISRLKSKMPWGIEVPENPEHVMYVWFDALINYISTLGWPDDLTTFSKFWPGMQIAGKDNLRQQSAMWQAMLLSAGLPPSQGILINGFISVAGQKMSKSLGNVISPDDMVARYGAEATRYLLLRLGPVGDDADVTWDKFDATYTAELANGIGNVSSRVIALCGRESLTPAVQPTTFSPDLATAIEAADFQLLSTYFTSAVTELDELMSTTQPWTLEGAAKITALEVARAQLLQLAYDIQLILPATAQQILDQLMKTPTNKFSPLFVRLPPPHG